MVVYVKLKKYNTPNLLKNAQAAKLQNNSPMA